MVLVPVRKVKKNRTFEADIEMELREKDIEQNLIDAVQARGGLCLKWVSPGCTGVPDRIVILPGNRIYFIELKKPGKKSSARQELMQAELKARGCEVQVVDSERVLNLVIVKLFDLREETR